MPNDILVFNGIDAETGDYLLPPMTAEALSRSIRDERTGSVSVTPQQDPVQQELQWRRRQLTERQFAPEEGVDPKNLEQTGWGVIFPATAGDSLRGQLTELLDRRKAQAGPLYREFLNQNGYRPGDTKRGFLARHGASSGWVKPALMPYYLLIVGSPVDIPYLFQYELDVQHAVGRIWFDTPEEYGRYAHSVVEAEEQPVRPKSAIFAGVRNSGDHATELSATQLITPLADHVAADQPAWQVKKMLAAETTKSALLPLFGESDTPALLFTASHGVGFSVDHALQRKHQGALLCQDWPGPGNHHGAIPPEFYISGDDIGGDRSLLGLITFHFACYGAGTPQLDDFSHAEPLKERKALASKPFVAQLPKRMLGHENGGALASIGHIDRAWGYSFLSEGGQQLSSFESMLKRLMEGHPVGSAMEAFNSYFAEVATDLSSVVEEAIWAKPESIDDLAIASLWTRHNDARAYAIVGDPAVRINVTTNGTADANPYIVIVSANNPVADPESTPPIRAGQSSPVPTPLLEAPGDVRTGSESLSSTTPDPAPNGLVIRVDFDERASVESGAPAGPDVNYGLFDSASDLKATIGDLVRTVARTVQDALSDAVSLRVVTYTSDSLETVTLDPDRGNFTGSARMRAVTRLSADGDTLLCLPEEDGEVNEQIWAIHSEAVAHAQAYRADLIKSVLSATAGLIPK